MLERTRNRIHEILEAARSGDRASRAFDIFILSLIGLNVLALILGTVESIRLLAPRFFTAFEFFSVMVFSVEYLLRVWSCTVSPDYPRPIRGRLRFALTPMALIDLLAILPFYLPFLGVDLHFIRAVRLFRIFRVAKLGRYSAELRTFRRILTAKKRELLITLFALLLLLLLSSAVMYYAERNAQPKAFSSIPAAMWWAVCALTTVGYGDVVPATLVGKLASSAISILGIGIFGLPAGILASGFIEEIQTKRTRPDVCPHCGKHIQPDNNQ